MGLNRAQENRKIRQEALRDQLAEQCRVQHILENIKKMEDGAKTIEPGELNAIKTANDQRLRLLNKYLPDLKQSDISVDGELTATDKTRAELEARLVAAGINPDAL